jgi:hypothetical protein
MQNYKLIENKDPFQKRLGTYCYAMVTTSETSDQELIGKLCDHEHRTIDGAKGCEEAINRLEVAGYDPTGRMAIIRDKKYLLDLIKKYPNNIMTRFDYMDIETWPKDCADVLMFSTEIGFAVGQYQVDELTNIGVFSDWNDRISDDEDADYIEVPAVTHYLLLEVPE